MRKPIIRAKKRASGWEQVDSVCTWWTSRENQFQDRLQSYRETLSGKTKPNQTRHPSMGTGEMAQKLRTLATLPEVLSSVPDTHVKQSSPSSGLYRQALLTHASASTHMCTH